MDALVSLLTFAGSLAAHSDEVARLLRALLGLARGGSLPADIGQRVEQILPSILPTEAEAARLETELHARGG